LGGSQFLNVFWSAGTLACGDLIGIGFSIVNFGNLGISGNAVKRWLSALDFWVFEVVWFWGLANS
jgi:hypothetical protein